ncbi:MAG: hypothetical protein M1830_004618 [Pleopsidium flavum]|nr:MAG: hypothetical protein M1830_004618 [Pleopsidium flavum]
MPGVPPDALAQVKKGLKGLFKRSKQKGPETSAERPTPSSTIQGPPAHGVAAPINAAATSSTTAAAPEAAEIPKPTGSTTAAKGFVDTGLAEPITSEPHFSEPAKPEEATTLEPHSTSATSKPIPGLSATSGPLNDHPAHGYTEMADASKTTEQPFTDNEAAEDPPFATPMEAPETARLGKLTDPVTADNVTKSA